MEQLWKSDLFVDDNTLLVKGARLHKKLEEIELNNAIETYATGYGTSGYQFFIVCEK